LGINEEYPVAVLDHPTEEITEKTYGALKAGCEQVIQNYFPGRSLIVRPGLIVGPGDPTGRFTYWPKVTHAMQNSIGSAKIFLLNIKCRTG
jgi:2'-hydroxyisoflavone reductase